MVWFFAHNHNVISYYNHILQVSKTLVQLALKDISCPCHSKRHYIIPKSSRLIVESSKKGWSFIKVLVPITFLAITHRHDTCICKQLDNVLRCFKVVWFPHDCFVRLVRSKQILCFKLPSFSFPSTSTKLLIHGVASCIGFRAPALINLSISC